MRCSDCAGQCALLCGCMPPSLRTSLDTSQPSRPADLYPTVTPREAEKERGSEGGESKRLPSSERANGEKGKKWDEQTLSEGTQREGKSGGGWGGVGSWRAGKGAKDAAMDNSERVKRGKGWEEESDW